MTVKILELRDKDTFIPIFAFRPNPAGLGQAYLVRRAGFGLESETSIAMLKEARRSFGKGG